MNQRTSAGIVAIAVLVVAQGCVAPQPSQDLFAPTEAQLKIRSAQTRSFDVKDRQAAMRGVMAALQDLGFIIERANESLGLVTAARFAEPNYYDVVGVTVTVRPEGRLRLRRRRKKTNGRPGAAAGLAGRLVGSEADEANYSCFSYDRKGFRPAAGCAPGRKTEGVMRRRFNKRQYFKQKGELKIDPSNIA